MYEGIVLRECGVVMHRYRTKTYSDVQQNANCLNLKQKESHVQNVLVMLSLIHQSVLAILLQFSPASLPRSLNKKKILTMQSLQCMQEHFILVAFEQVIIY